MPSNQMTQSDASRIQSSQAKSGGDMSSSGFAGRAQSAGDRNNASTQAGGGGTDGGEAIAGAGGNQGAGAQNPGGK
ncbi:hypothetical protein P7C70_g1986, partial [Phenoliferia sp. Uapishka_3]